MKLELQKNMDENLGFTKRNMDENLGFKSFKIWIKIWDCNKKYG